eukprot:224921_1
MALNQEESKSQKDLAEATDIIYQNDGDEAMDDVVNKMDKQEEEQGSSSDNDSLYVNKDQDDSVLEEIEGAQKGVPPGKMNDIPANREIEFGEESDNSDAIYDGNENSVSKSDHIVVGNTTHKKEPSEEDDSSSGNSDAIYEGNENSVSKSEHVYA